MSVTPQVYNALRVTLRQRPQGVFSSLKSDLEIPQPLPKLFTLYLLLSIGFKGGVELRQSSLNTEIVLTLSFAILFSMIIPIYTFFILLYKKLSVYNAGAVAASYGSVSAVTFITANAFLQTIGIQVGGHMVAAMTLMEFPAIIVSILLVRIFSKGTKPKVSFTSLFHEALLNSSVFLLLGSFFVGFLSGEVGNQALKPFTEDIFKGMLSFFLLDMGIITATKIKDFKNGSFFLIIFAIVVPLINAFIGIVIAKLIGMSIGNALLFTVLCASASYIAVPAAMRIALPKASPSIYVPMALAITFPFNIIVGIPLYLMVIKALS